MAASQPGPGDREDPGPEPPFRIGDETGGLRTRVNAELSICRVQMTLHGILGNEELEGDFPVRQPHEDHAEGLLLPVRELRALPAAHGILWNYDHACIHRADRRRERLVETGAPHDSVDPRVEHTSN